MNADQLLERIATTLKRDIGPAVEGEYPKTQAFMAAVVLQKLGRQLGLAAVHKAADEADTLALLDDLRVTLEQAPPPAGITAAVATLAAQRDEQALCGLISALYGARAELGEERFTALLGRVRKNLRASIDRRMVYAA
jgi:hypothetical protein